MRPLSFHFAGTIANPPQPTTLRATSLFETAPRFDGVVYDPAVDHDRLRRQIGRVFGLMLDGRWRSLQEIADATGDPHALISAQFRHLRKPRFGGHAVEKRRRVILAERGGGSPRRLPVLVGDDIARFVMRSRR